MKFKALLIQLSAILSAFSLTAQIQITVNPTQEIKEISPYIYGRNNNLSDNPSSPTKATSWQLYKDAGLKFLRESGGNNSTKYNWKKKLSSHPDWYNNVYAHDWDYAAKSLQTNMPDAKGMWSFQLLGYVAKTGAANFGDYAYNKSQWWKGVAQNLAGGGTVNPDPNSTKALVDGDINLYLQPWTADSTTAILTQWFDNLGLNKDQFQYWNMDNEPECWNGTHDDVVTSPMPAEDYIQQYVAVAIKARALFPNIKIVGPVFTNEWQWYNWQNGDAVTDPVTKKKYCWAEYFIKRISEEQAKLGGIRLLDVLDFHFYPGSDQNGTLQLHRVFYDTSYTFPGANGVHRVNGGWDTSINQEYIFKRATDWLNKYMGAGNGVTMGMTEFGSIYNSDPNVVAVCYASLLGTFAENNVEIFSPWEWNIGEWEVLHLFTHYAGTTAVSSTSSQNNTVSAYSSVNAGRSTLSVVLVNRDATNSQAVNISPTNVTIPNGTIAYYQLSSLPSTETFISATNNALKQGSATVSNGSIALTLPKLSVTVIQISLTTPASTACDVSSIELPAGATISGQTITANIANSVTSQTVSVTVSPNASWKLYSDAACTNEISNNILTLSVGANTAYIKVTAEDGVTTQIYKLVVTRAAATYAITIVPSNNGSVSASTNSATEGTTVTLSVAPNAGYELDVISAYQTGNETSTVTLTGTGNSRSFTMPAFNVTVTATFKVIPSLSVSPASLNFVATGEQQTFYITSNTDWTVSSSDVWLTVSPASGSNNGTVTVTAEDYTDIFQRTATITVSGVDVASQTISVAQDAYEIPSVIPDETQPVGLDGKGIIELSLSIPSNATLTGSFEIQFPEGISLDETLTALSAALSNNFSLVYTFEGNNTWLIEIKSKALKSAVMSAEYQKIMDIDYIVANSVQKGSYNAIITNLDFMTNNNVPITEDLLTVPIHVERAATSIENIHDASLYACIVNNVLKIESSNAETITIYSVAGVQLYSTTKDAGLIEIPITSLPAGSVFFIKGSISGAIKIIK